MKRIKNINEFIEKYDKIDPEEVGIIKQMIEITYSYPPELAIKNIKKIIENFVVRRKDKVKELIKDETYN